MVGGFLGAVCRFLIGTWELLQSHGVFPFATLMVNLVGSFFLGWIVGFLRERYPKLFLFLGTGFVGSFTTFSTFSVEVLTLLEKGELWLTFIYIFVSLVAGIVLSLIGYRLALHYKRRDGRSI